jgi:superfamily II DNA helicase RecQ
MQRETTLALLREMLGPGAEFRDGQWEAIDLAANQRRRLLVVRNRPAEPCGTGVASGSWTG